VIHVTSPTERERRYVALRTAMDAAGYEALLVSGRGDEFMRGRIQYVSDVFQWAGWGFLLLLSSGEASFLADPLGGYAEGAGEPWLSDIRVTATPGHDLASILHGYGVRNGSVGVVGLADITGAAHLRELTAALPDVALDDATDLFDDVRAIKSHEEIENLAETSAILRAVFVALEAEIRPGVREFDVLAEAHRLCRQYGCVEGIALIGRQPAPGFGPGSEQPLKRGDIVVIDLEWGGPSGYWLELRRCFSFGPPPDAVRRFWEARVEVFEACIEAIRPGVSSQEILAARDRVSARHGLRAGEDIRYSAHGIGLDSLEPPWVPGKQRELKAGMMLSLHPNVELTPSEAGVYGSVSVGDNVVVTAGGARRMTYDVEEWVVLES